MVIDTIAGTAGLIVVYLIIGMVVVFMAGGRDPISHGPPWIMFVWPLVALLILGEVLHEIKRSRSEN